MTDVVERTVVVGEDEESIPTDVSNAEMTEKLVKPFPARAIKERQGGRAKLKYVEGSTVIRRLIAATGNRFNFEILKHEVLPWIKTSGGDEQQLLVATVRLEIEGLGYRDGIGVQIVNPRGGEDLFKGAITDGLKKAATNFGVGLELYSPDYEAIPETPKVRVPPKDQSPERVALGKALRERGINTKALADKAAMKDFQKPLDELTEDQIKDWLSRLNVAF